jgi:IS30 family transposase
VSSLNKIQKGVFFLNYSHFTIDERACIALYLEKRLSVPKIAELIGRHFSSVYREIKRNSDENGKYDPSLAEVKASMRQTNRKNHVKYTVVRKKKIEKCLLQKWSPEQIVGHYREMDGEFVCHKTVYRWIRQGKLLHGDISVLRRKGKKYRRRTDVNRMSGGKSIHDRPKEAKERTRVGDWELDTVVGCKGTKSCLLTIVDRKSRYLKATLLPDRKANRVSKAIESLLKDDVVHTLTADNGKEFSDFEYVEKTLNADVFFADPYASWQRGTNENTNGLLREFIPKGLDIGVFTEEQLQEFVYMINTRPRKVLNYRTTEQVYLSSA